MQQLAANQANAHVPVNENFATLRWAEVYGNDPDIISALHRGYLGGRWGSFDFTAVDHTFGASTTTYVSVDRSDGTLDFSTSSTNYLDSTNYATVETVVTGASSITSVVDDRGGPGGVHGGGGSVGGSGGTVTHTAGALTANAVVLGAGTDDAKVVAGITTDGTSALNLGVAGASVGKVVLANATSGTITVQPPTGALGTVTLTAPATTGTLALVAQITGTNSGTNTGDETTASITAKVNTVTALSIVSGVVDIDCALGDYFTLTLTANVTSITFSNLPGSGKGASKWIEIVQGSGPYTVAWPASFKWAGGTTGVVSTVNATVDELAITTVNNGTAWKATLGKAFA